MAQIKISELPAAGAANDAMQLEVNDAGTSKRLTIAQVYSAQGANRLRKDVATLLADTTLTYTAAQPATVTAGDIIGTREEGFAYKVAASGASDHHVTTAGGVKLYVTADVVQPEMLGAVGYDFTDLASILTAPDETAFLQDALAIGRPVFLTRHYRTTEALTVTPKQKISGIDRTTSGIVVGSDFNMAATGVLVFTSPGGPRDGGQQLDGFRVAAYQDVTISLRANLITYPPAINIATAGDPSFGKLRISGFTTGVVSTTNPNGADFGDLELGTFTVGLDTGPFAHFVRIGNLDHWVWDFDPDTDNITSVFLDGTNIAADFGRIDGVQIAKMGSFQGEFRFTDAFGTIGQLNCDGSFSRLTLLGDCDLSIGAFYSTSAATADDWAIRMAGTNSRCNIGSAFIFVDNTSVGAGAIQCLGPKCSLQIGELYTRNSGNSRMIYVEEGFLGISNGFLGVDGANIGGLVNRTADNILVTANGTLDIGNTRANARTAGAADMLVVNNVVGHRFTNNVWPSWSVNFVATGAVPVTLLEGNNWGTKISRNRLISARRHYYYTAVLNASGAAVIPHGLGDVRPLRPHAYTLRVGASTERVPIAAVTYIDNVNIGIKDPAGAAAAGFTVNVHLEVDYA